MRALCALVVACLAVASGAGRSEARAATVACIAPSSVRAAVHHPALDAVALRAGRTRGVRASHSLPPVSLAAGWWVDPPRRVVTAALPPACDRRGDRPVRTGSARGPPIG